MGVGRVLKPDRCKWKDFVRADTPGFQAKGLSWESSRLLLTFLRQEINKWAELEKQIILRPALGTPQQLSPVEETSHGDTESIGTAKEGSKETDCPRR